jgi:hypothetical protein
MWTFIHVTDGVATCAHLLGSPRRHNIPRSSERANPIEYAISTNATTKSLMIGRSGS